MFPIDSERRRTRPMDAAAAATADTDALDQCRRL